MGGGGLNPDLNPLCLRVNATSLDQDLDQNARVNGAYESGYLHSHLVLRATESKIRGNSKLELKFYLYCSICTFGQ